jgi:hypothetical protein
MPIENARLAPFDPNKEKLLKNSMNDIIYAGFFNKNTT